MNVPLPFHSTDGCQLAFQLITFWTSIFYNGSKTSDKSSRSWSRRLEFSRSCQHSQRSGTIDYSHWMQVLMVVMGVMVVMPNSFSVKVVLVTEGVP